MKHVTPPPPGVDEQVWADAQRAALLHEAGQLEIHATVTAQLSDPGFGDGIRAAVGDSFEANAYRAAAQRLRNRANRIEP